MNDYKEVSIGNGKVVKVPDCAVLISLYPTAKFKCVNWVLEFSEKGMRAHRYGFVGGWRFTIKAAIESVTEMSNALNLPRYYNPKREIQQMTKREQQHINLSIDHCVKLGPGYPVATGHGNIEWHTFGGVWRDKFNVGTKYTAINMAALYQLCAANGWVVDFRDTHSTDPRDDTKVNYDEAVRWVNAQRAMPPHPQAEQFRQNYLNHITKS